MSNSSFYSNTGITSADVSSITSAKEAAATSETNAATSATEAANSATQAATSATNAASSETNVSNSAATATTSAANASTSETNASASAATATTQASNAATSATAAAGSASTAGTSATNAASSATNAATSETNAATSATNAANSATSAATSATNAGTSETNAAASASSASGYVTSATTQANNAATSATAAATSETNAASSATAASTSASGASTSASNANTSATNAASSASQAASSAAAAALAADNFDDTYLGSNASDPTTDNDGDALNAGDLHFNTSSNTLKVYNGSAWQDAAIDSSGFVQTTGDTMTGALDVQSTITADGLTVDGDGTFSATNPTVDIKATNGNDASLILMETTGNDFGANGANGFRSRYDGGDNALYIQSGAETTIRNRIKVDRDTGDISFYEDTGTTPKFFWDASAESLGIGTTSPSAYGAGYTTVGVNGSTMSGVEGFVGGTLTSYTQTYAAQTLMGTKTATPLVFVTNDTPQMRITSSGSVGIGTSSIDNKVNIQESALAGRSASNGNTSMTIEHATDTGIQFFSATQTQLRFGDAASTGAGSIVYAHGDDSLRVSTNGSERMRITSSGSVGIGTTSPSAPLEVTRSTAGIAQYITNTGSGQAYTAYGNSDNPPWSQDFNTAGGLLVGIDSDESGILFQGGNYALRFGTNGTDRMRITSEGDVGIGGVPTNASDHKSLALFGNASTGAGFIEFNDTSGNADAAIFADNGNLFINADYDNATANSSIRFRVDGSSEKMRLDSSGTLMMATTNPDVSFSSTQTGIAMQPGAQVHLSSSGTALILNHPNNITGTLQQFRYNGSIVGTISNTSSSTSYNETSDHRLKENVVELTGATTRLKQLEPKRFNFIADADTTVDGFLAHEVQSVVPEAVTGTHNEVDGEGNPVYQGIDKSKLVPLLVATIQELEARITALENA